MMADEEEIRKGAKQMDERQRAVGLPSSPSSSSSFSSSRICQLLMIHMTGGAPFGFRIASIQANGFSPFVVSMIRMNGKAYRSGLQESDLVLAINGFSCYSFISHQSATKLMEYDDPELTLHILRGDSVCEDDIRASLQSLDSQILVLTDEEIQTVIEKKQSTQHLKPQISRSAYISNPSQRSASPFRLQPPPQNRGKLQKDRQAAFKHEEQNELASDVSADGSIKQSMRGKTEEKVAVPAANTDTRNEPKNSFITELNQSGREHKLNVSEYQPNYAQMNFYRLQDPMNREATNERNTNAFNGDSGSENRSFDHLHRNGEKQRSLEVTAIIENEMNTFQDSNLKKQNYDQQKEKLDSSTKEHFRSRYRVEQTIEFKPLQQSRYYDADSGQFKENNTAVPQKRRSNSISSYHMYISPIGFQSSSSSEGCNGSLSFDTGSNNWQKTNFTQNMCNSKTTPLGSSKQMPVLALSENPIPQNQYNIPSNITSITGFEGVSPRDMSLLGMVERAVTWDNAADQSPRTHQHSLNISNSSLKTSSSLQIHSPTTSETNRFVGSASLNSTEAADSPRTTHYKSSKIIDQFSMFPDTPSALHGHHSAPYTTKADSKLIHIRSSAANEVTGASRSVCADQSKCMPNRRSFHPSEYRSEGVRSDTTLRFRPSSATLSTRSRKFEPGQSYRPLQQITINDGICRSTNVRPSASADPPQLLLHDNIAMNEGKGGRLFARRRANSDAWIVGERGNTRAPVVDGEQETVSGIRENEASNSLPRRRRSFLANHHQRPIGYNCEHNSMGKPMAVDSFSNSYLTHQPFEGGPQSLDYSSIPMHRSFQLPAMTSSPKQWNTKDSIRQNSDRRVRDETSLESCDQESQSHRPTQKQRYFHRTLGYTDL